MMSEVRRVEIFIRYPRPESLVTSLRYFPMAVQHKAMRKVFRQHPKHDAEGNEGQRAQKMMRTNSEYQQDYCVRGIEGGSAIDLSPRDDFLFALVGAIRVLPAHWRKDLIRGHRGKWTSIDMMIANAGDFV